MRRFLYAETSGAMLLVAATVAALVWANLPGDTYTSVWETRLAISLGDHAIATDLRGWVNEGLMTLFFLVVGLEAKRERDLGELRDRSRLAIPVVAGLGGMVGAASIYLAFNAGGPGAHGWGAALSTDTALALGALSLLSRGRAIRMRVFLLTVVVVDDLLALAAIAFFYSDKIDAMALVIAIALFAAIVALRFADFSWRGQVATLLGIGTWLALFESGIDPVITGLLVGLVTTAYPPSRDALERGTERAVLFREQPTPELAYEARASLTSAISLNERLQYRLLPWTSQVIVPLFALANAGIHFSGDLLSDALRSRVTWGIVAAYAIGKPLGILGASWLGTRKVFGGQRLTLTWPALAGVGTAAGMAFTVSLLVASIAFGDRPGLLDQAKLGVLLTLIVGPALTKGVLWVMQHLPDELRARQLGGTADVITDLADDVDPTRDHIRGNPDAPVTIVEYGDFQCPYCGAAAPVIARLLEHFGDDLRYVWRHLPLSDVHPDAQLAAEAAEAAHEQGKFWEMHDRLLADQDDLRMAALFRHAAALGLDYEEFNDDLTRRRMAPRIAEDVATADMSGVSGTPTFFVNGRRHQGVYDVDTLTREVKAAYAAAERAGTTSAGTPGTPASPVG
ncbi:MAG TPA: Na+/H+ antiporter NhaA [Baekduia sp.]